MTGAWTNTKMRVSIERHPGTPGMHRMVVDGHGLVLDLSKVSGQLLDPTVTSITWQLRGDTHGGIITLQDGTKRPPFWNSELLKPYLDAWRTERDNLLGPAA